MSQRVMRTQFVGKWFNNPVTTIRWIIQRDRDIFHCPLGYLNRQPGKKFNHSSRILVYRLQLRVYHFAHSPDNLSCDP